MISTISSQITGVSIVYSSVCSGADQRKHQSPASLAFVRGIHRRLVDSPDNGKCFNPMTSSWYLQSLRLDNRHKQPGCLQFLFRLPVVYPQIEREHHVVVEMVVVTILGIIVYGKRVAIVVLFVTLHWLHVLREWIRLLYCLIYISSVKHWENTSYLWALTHWGRVTHICASKLTIIGSDNGLSPRRRQAIIWTNAGILLIIILGTNFCEIIGKIHSFSFKKMHLKMSSAKGRLFSLGLNELKSFQVFKRHLFQR